MKTKALVLIAIYLSMIVIPFVKVDSIQEDEELAIAIEENFSFLDKSIEVIIQPNSEETELEQFSINGLESYFSNPIGTQL